MLVILREFLVNPVTAVVSPPHLAVNQTARDRAPGENDTPQVPAARPFGFGAFENPTMVGAIERHRQNDIGRE